MADVELIAWEGPQRPQSAEIMRRLGEQGYDSFSWSDGPGAVYAPHQHPHDECLWMLQGEMEFGIEGRTYLLSTGARLVLPRHTVHSARVLGDQAAHYVIGQRP